MIRRQYDDVVDEGGVNLAVNMKAHIMLKMMKED